MSDNYINNTENGNVSLNASGFLKDRDNIEWGQLEEKLANCSMEQLGAFGTFLSGKSGLVPKYLHNYPKGSLKLSDKDGVKKMMQITKLLMSYVRRLW